MIDFGNSPLYKKMLTGEKILAEFDTEIVKGLGKKEMKERHDQMLEQLSNLMLEVGFGYKLTQQMNRGDQSKTQGRLAILSSRAQKLLKARKELISIYSQIIGLNKQIP